MSDTTNWYRDPFTRELTRWRAGVRARIVPIRDTDAFRIVIDGRSILAGRSVLLCARLFVREELALAWADRMLEILEPVPPTSTSEPVEVSP